jgi:hypothetical protein
MPGTVEKIKIGLSFGAPGSAFSPVVSSKKRSSAGRKNRAVPTVPADPGVSMRPDPVEPERKARVIAPWIGFVLVALLCCVWVMVHAYMVDTVTVRLCNQMDKDTPSEKRLPVFLSEIAFDGYVWNRHAEHLGENGEWRVRYTSFDNAPKGREQIGWNSAFAWYLRALGEIYRAQTGESLRNSIFRMSIWANPILLVIAIGVFSTMSALRFGPLCGAVIAIGMVAVPTFYEGFMPAYPDHHGLIAFTLLGMLFGIAWAGAGWVQGAGGNDFVPPHSLKQARHGMIFSAVCSAAGLWISAFSAAVAAVGIGLAVIAAAAIASLTKRGKSESTHHPELWTLWGTTTALVGLGLYLLEYFPNHLRFGLEVNQPLYLLAWYAGGVALSALTRWIMRPDRSPGNFPKGKVALCALVCALIPACVLIGRERVFVLLDPFNVLLLKRIAETLPLLTRIATGGLTWGVAFGWYPILILIAAVLLFLSSVGRCTKYCLIVLSVPILFATGMQFSQTRWGMLAGPFYIALAGIVIPQVWRLVPRRKLERLLASGGMVILAWMFIVPTFRNTFSTAWTQFRSGERVPLTPGQALGLLHRQMARAILDDSNGRPVVVLSSPNSSCLLAALGGMRTIGTLYWDNTEGLKSAAWGLNAQTDQDTLEFMKAHGVTHVSLLTWENFIEPFFEILHQTKPPPEFAYQNSFGKRALFDRVIPPYTRPLIFPPNFLTKSLGQQVLMLAFDPNQSMIEAKLHLNRFVRLVEQNPVAAEVSLKQLIEDNPGFTPGRLELAQLFHDQGRFPEMAKQVALCFPSDPESRTLERAAESAISDRPDIAIGAAEESLNSSNAQISKAAELLISHLKKKTSK